MTSTMTRSWLLIAHRGACGEAPEHTRSAFVRALAYGVDMIELDVHLTRDGELVVIHDDDLGRTTNGAGAVRAHDLRMLRTLDAGAWFGPEFCGEGLLTLAEVVALVDGRARLNVELKSPQPDWPGQAARVAELLRSTRLVDSTIVSCFEPEALAALRREDPEVRLGLLWAHTELVEAWAWARRLGAVSFHPHWTLASEATIRAAHDRGLQVFVWTVNDLAVMEQLVAMGADGMISDFPGRFRAVGAHGALGA